MTKLTKGEWTTLTLKREVKKLLEAYKKMHRFDSFNEALLDALSLAFQYRELAKLIAKHEMVKQVD